MEKFKCLNYLLKDILLGWDSNRLFNDLLIVGEIKILFIRLVYVCLKNWDSNVVFNDLLFKGGTFNLLLIYGENQYPLMGRIQVSA
ncbi:unnamed protein product [Arabidopsis halleri]